MFRHDCDRTNGFSIYVGSCRLGTWQHGIAAFRGELFNIALAIHRSYTYSTQCVIYQTAQLMVYRRMAATHDGRTLAQPK